MDDDNGAEQERALGNGIGSRLDVDDLIDSCPPEDDEREARQKQWAAWDHNEDCRQVWKDTFKINIKENNEHLERSADRAARAVGLFEKFFKDRNKS